MRSPTVRPPLTTLALLLAVASAPGAQEPSTAPAAPLRYSMVATLEPATRTIAGRLQVRWINASGEPTSEVWLSLPWNAWNGDRSAWLGSLPAPRRAAWREADFGGLRILSLRDETSDSVLDWRYVAVDLRAPEDRTVARAMLPAPLPPGAVGALTIEFVATAPLAHDGIGHAPADGFVAIGWFPRLGRLEQEVGAEGGSRAVWRCPPWSPEAIAPPVRADFEVRLDVPLGFAVGATGGPPVETATVADAARQRLHFVATGVEDFGWVADPDFTVREVALLPVAGTGAEPALGPAPLRLLAPTARAAELAGRIVATLDAVRRTVGARLGPDDRPLRTVVLAGRAALRAGDLLIAPDAEHGLAAAAIAAAFAPSPALDLVAGVALRGRRIALEPGATSDLALRLPSARGALPWRLPLDALADLAAPAAGGSPPWPAGWQGTLLPDAPLLASLAAQPLAAVDRALPMPAPRLAAATVSPDQRIAAALALLEHQVGAERVWSLLRRWRDPAGARDAAGWRALLDAELGVGPAETFRAAIEPGAVLDHGIVAVDRDPSGSGQAVVVARRGDLRIDVPVRCRFAGSDAVVTRVFPASEPRRVLRFELPRNDHGELIEVRIDAGPVGTPLDADLRDNGWRAAPDLRPALDRALRTLPQVQWRLLSLGFTG